MSDIGTLSAIGAMYLRFRAPRHVREAVRAAELKLDGSFGEPHRGSVRLLTTGEDWATKPGARRGKWRPKPSELWAVIRHPDTELAGACARFDLTIGQAVDLLVDDLFRRWA